jgi:Zn-dependent peptidase ImmA (M78 family)
MIIAANLDSAVLASARQVLEKHWDGKLPVDPLKIAQSMGVKVVLYDFTDETVVETGLLGNTPTIRLSRKADGTRTSFALAHALGHVALHRDKLTEFPEKGTDDGTQVLRPSQS